MLTNDQLWGLIRERLDKVDADNAALSHLIGAIGTGTRTIDPVTGGPILPEGGGAFNVEPLKPKRTSADVYWEAQPPEVQALRAIKDQHVRETRAHELAGQGYAIDKRIMVWLWDPLTSMRAWKEGGYTWIPALGQPDIPVSPGLTFFGKPSYDPANAPPGSIKVDTSFAVGFEE